MNNLVTRSLSGIVYVALIVGSIIAGPYWFMVLMICFSILAMHEFRALTHSDQPTSAIVSAIGIIDMGAAVALCASAAKGQAPLMNFSIIMICYIIVRATLALYDKRDNALRATAMSALSVIYIGLPLATSVLISESQTSTYLILIMFIMIWLNDTGAYCVGCTLGRHRLFPRLSPKKSWEGFWGGMIFCIAAGGACYWSSVQPEPTLVSGGSLWAWLGLGAVVSLFSTWGDLFESMIKRTLGVKDSGRLIPGHGGILDRIDSLLFVAPAAFIYAIATGII